MTVQRYERIPEWTQGDRLRKAREMMDLGQREFAELIGVSHQTVTNAEKGHRAVRKITMNAWALATGVSVEWLATGAMPGDGGPGTEGDGSQPIVHLVGPPLHVAAVRALFPRVEAPAA